VIFQLAAGVDFEHRRAAALAYDDWEIES